jgi:hypothetical protein
VRALPYPTVIVTKLPRFTLVFTAGETFLTIKQVRNALNKLTKTNEITTKGTNKYTMLTVNNYDTYQIKQSAKGQTEGKQRANKGQTEGKQRATTKEGKERKEEKKLDANAVFESMTRAAIGKEYSNQYLMDQAVILLQKYPNVKIGGLQGLVITWVGNLNLRDKNEHRDKNSYI